MSRISFCCLIIWLAQALLCAAGYAPHYRSHPRVNLGYATYEGVALRNGVNQYLGMRYAASPVGENRFKQPKPPRKELGVVKANEFGPLCLSVQGLATETTPLAAAEDCLFIDVFAPANSRKANLPIMLWIQGGGYNTLFNPNYNGSGIIEAAKGEMIVVSFNYRVGPFGFLASKELAAEKNLNIGLQDQRAAIKWVSQHISKFGGDPKKITLFGTSIGAGSIVLQTLAYNGNPPREATVDYAASIAASVYLPAVHEVHKVQFQYDKILNLTNCSDLHCLRSLSSEDIQAANIAQPFPGQSEVPDFPYSPVIDGSLLTAQPSAMLAAGHFAKDKPIAIGSSRTEGTIFTPPANTSADIVSFFQTQFPDLTEDDVVEVEKTYTGVPSTLPGVTAKEAPLYFRLAEMYGDVSFACPALQAAANLSEAGVPVHLFRDNIVDPVELAAGFVVPHTWELLAIWGPEYATQYVALPNATSYLPGGVNHAIVPEVQGYWTSFATTLGDPNRFKQRLAPTWATYGTGERLRLQTNATAMERITLEELARCAAWNRVSSRTHL